MYSHRAPAVLSIVCVRSSGVKANTIDGDWGGGGGISEQKRNSIIATYLAVAVIDSQHFYHALLTGEPST